MERNSVQQKPTCNGRRLFQRRQPAQRSAYGDIQAFQDIGDIHQQRTQPDSFKSSLAGC